MVAHVIFRPFGMLVEAIDRISPTHLELDFPKRRRSYEVGVITQAFESMLNRLKQSLVSRDRLQQEIERKEVVESELRVALEQVKRSNSELEQFAYVASHDLQEPLRMVASYNQLLAERYGPQLDDKARKFIHYAVDGSRRMQQLIQDLLNLSRVTTRGGEFKALDFHEVVATAMQNLELVIDREQVKIDIGPMPTVMGDGGQLVQLVQNLLANAIKFRSEETPHIEIEATLAEGLYRFSVKDNGIGIDRKFQEKIFIIFQRLHTREEYEGTGIGLALCKKIVERHGGTIWFLSEPGRGATFYFTLRPAVAA